MCGIAGIFAYCAGGGVEPQELATVRDAMAHRGPDGQGLWVAPRGEAGLAHRRLAIIDTGSGGAQPMATPDGRYHVTFNGEIYNYRALRQSLQSAGVSLRTASDTEVLLHLYAAHGARMVDHLRGMYAFAIYDAVEQTLFLARDPFGIKPLYYADDGKRIVFASQVKALLMAGGIDRAPQPAGHVGFFVWGHVPDPFTLYRGIKALPAGSTLVVRRRGMEAPLRFFDPASELAHARSEGAVRDAGTAGERLHAALRDSVRHHLVADVPVGIFLSAGLDSATLGALASEASGAMHAVTLGFEEFRGTADDETALASLVAQRYGMAHDVRWVSRADFEQECKRILSMMDQPSIDGVNTYFVSRAAAESGMKVALSGLGGDELFAGYPSFHDVPLMARRMLGAPRAVGRALRRLLAPAARRFTSPKYASLLEYGGSYSGAYLLRRGLFMPWELDEFLDPAFAREGWESLDSLQALEATAAPPRDPADKVTAL
jgi:asparagine synthase (glutamine-hydrolysing)